MSPLDQVDRINCPKCKKGKHFSIEIFPKGEFRYHATKFIVDETYKTKSIQRYTCNECGFVWDEVQNEV